jgi:hypothetical protein
MLLHAGALTLIRNQLELIAQNKKVSIIVIGQLTNHQHAEISRLRMAIDLPPLDSPDLVYLGRHHFESRHRDGYSIEDMLLQINSVLSATSVIEQTKRMTALTSVGKRDDGYGNLVSDRAILELTSRKPRAEVYSVIPRGDNRFNPKSK